MQQKHTPEFKMKVALEALQEKLTQKEIAAKYNLNPRQVSEWKNLLLANADLFFDKRKFEKAKKEQEEQVKRAKEEKALERQLKQLTLERDWLKKNYEASLARKAQFPD